MDPIRNPFAPGAGTPPPELAGRDAVRAAVEIALERARHGRPAKSVLMVGLRGVGKTVLLERMRMDAEERGIVTVRAEAPEGRSLPALLAPELRLALLSLSRNARARALAERGLRALAGFATALKLRFKDIEIGFDQPAEPGLADNGDLERDLQVLLEAAGEAARKGETVLAMFIDELQYVLEEQLAALITALHRCAQRALPVVLVGAGLPSLRGRMGDAKSYAERLFEFPEIGPLPEDAARRAIEKPIRDQGAGVTDAALAAIIRHAQGYPYFLQEWGKHAWDVADKSPITDRDVERATATVIPALDQGFFRVRYDRSTPAERLYLRAMAELGPGSHRSGDIADLLGRSVTALGPVRAHLIAKGMIWSPAHGDTAFTVPQFDAFMRRAEPWRPEG